MVHSYILRECIFLLISIAVQWCSFEAFSICCTKMGTRDCYLIHETQDLFGNIVGGVLSHHCGMKPYPAFSGYDRQPVFLYPETLSTIVIRNWLTPYKGKVAVSVLS
jgi:hypothetical protein